jgi:hypothetical protein
MLLVISVVHSFLSQNSNPFYKYNISVLTAFIVKTFFIELLRFFYGKSIEYLLSVQFYFIQLTYIYLHVIPIVLSCLEIIEYKSFEFVSLSNKRIGLDPLCFLINFRISVFVSSKDACWNFYKVCVEPMHKFIGNRYLKNI